MKVFVICLIAWSILCICLYVYCIIESNHYIKRLAKQNELEVRDLIIEHNKQRLNDSDVQADKDKIETFLDHIELWENVRNYKVNNKL